MINFSTAAQANARTLESFLREIYEIRGHFGSQIRYTVVPNVHQKPPSLISLIYPYFRLKKNTTIFDSGRGDQSGGIFKT